MQREEFSDVELSEVNGVIVQRAIGQVVLAWAVCSGLCAGGANAQRSPEEPPVNPVYLADAPVAVETIDRALALSAQGNHIEGARVLGTLIAEHGNQLTPFDNEQVSNDAIWIPVRRKVERVLLEHPDLLDAYRRIFAARAERMSEDGDWERATELYWLTEVGGYWSLNQSQMLIESARFGAGVRELDRLRTHPDAAVFASRAKALSILALQASRTDDARRVAQDWAKIAGDAFVEPTPFARPTTDDQQQDIQLEGIVTRPIAAERLTPSPADDGVGLVGSEQERGSMVNRSGAAIKPKPWSIPTILDDAVITNDGVTISCFDRFTLRPRWRVTTKSLEEDPQDRTSAGVRSRIARTIEDVSSVTVSGDRVYAATGLARTGARTGDDRLMILDLDTGAMLHSTTLEQLDPTLEGSTIRGSVILDGDTVIVAARKNLRRERLVALSLVGIDRWSLEHKWTRPIGSAGSLPFQQIGQIAHSGVAQDGIVYWTDMMGIVCAVESSTGEVVWARSLPSPDVYSRYERDPWTTSSPVVANGRVFVLGSDGRMIRVFDAMTGEMLEESRAMVSGGGASGGEGLYLINCGDQIACVGQTSITMHSIERFGINKARVITPTGDGRSAIRGRVSSMQAGGGQSRLMVPIDQGLAILDPDRVGVRQIVELDRAGICAVGDGQIVVVDENEVSSFLSWDTARKLLDERIDESNDIDAAITLADLAFRSSHNDQIVGIIDRAIKLLGTTDNQSDARSRLFDVLISMIGLPESGGSDLGRSIRDQLIARSGRVASGPDQRLSYEMTRGAWLMDAGKSIEAVGVYHAVLSDQTLASGMWRGEGLAIRAQIEATRRIDQLVERYGRRICTGFDDLASAELTAIGDTATSEAYERLAQQYPWSVTTPNAWMLASTRHLDAGDAPAAIRSSQRGIDATKRLGQYGINIESTIIDQLGSVLIESLIATGQHDRAGIIADELSSSFDGIRLVVNGQEVSAGDPMFSTLAGSTGKPTLGSRFVRSAEPALVAGSPLRALDRMDDSKSMVFFAPQINQVRLIGFEDDSTQLLWSQPWEEGEPPIVVVHDQRQTVLLGTERIESVATQTGDLRWKIDNLASVLIDSSMREPDEIAQIDGQFVSPREGAVLLEQRLIGSDGSVAIITDRIGRALGVDLTTGRVLWKRDLPVNRVHEIDVASGVLGVIGMQVIDRNVADGIAEDQRARIVSIDARSGETIQILDNQTTVPRWVRVAPSGNLVVGTNQRILSVSSQAGSIDWVVHDFDLQQTNAGWIMDDQLIVLDEAAGLWMINLLDGKRDNASLATNNRIVERGWVDVRRREGGGLIVTGSAGMASFNATGGLAGLDPERTDSPFIGAGWGKDRLAMVKRAEIRDENSMSVEMLLLDQHSGVLHDRIDLTLPSSIQRQTNAVHAADGVVVVGFGEVSVVVRTE